MHRANYIGLTVIGLALSLGTGAVEGDVVAVVSAKSAVTTLSKSQVANIFLGKTARFPDGSQALPIDQSEGAAARDEFYTKFTGKSAAKLKAHWSTIIFTGRGRPPREVANDGDVKKLLANNHNAIGYVDKSALDAAVKVVPISP